jgi:predicted kinase
MHSLLSREPDHEHLSPRPCFSADGLDAHRQRFHAGCCLVVDGAFLMRWQREMFRQTAAALGLPFVILAVSAAEATLRERIARRSQRGADASEATIDVLDAQFRACEPVDADELPFVVRQETDGSQDTRKLRASPIPEALQRGAMPREHAA